MAMTEEIGEVAGAIWRVLESGGESSLAHLKKTVNATGPIFDWGIGWLAREDKIVITPQKRSFSVRLK